MCRRGMEDFILWLSILYFDTLIQLLSDRSWPQLWIDEYRPEEDLSSIIYTTSFSSQLIR